MQDRDNFSNKWDELLKYVFSMATNYSEPEQIEMSHEIFLSMFP